MNTIGQPIIDNVIQCWGCAVFDRLFQVVSVAAANIYKNFTVICAILFCVLFAFYVLNAVWKNTTGDGKDPLYQKTVKPVLINAIVVFAFLGLGVQFPRFISTITFEPVADIALIYTQSMVQTNPDTVNERVSYTAQPMSDNGFYTSRLRDSVILLMKTTISQFQSYMKLGIAIMDHAFSWKMLTGIGMLIKHIIMFLVGLYVFYGFFKLFAKFCFYFADIIVAMAFFAFFFPLSLVLVTFRGESAPKWMDGLGKKIGTDQLKSVIKAIVGLAAAVLTYVVIMVIIARFFSANDASTSDLMQLILHGDVFSADLSDDNLATMTIGGCVVLVYVLNFIQEQIPTITKMVMDTFNVSPETSIGDQLADSVGNVTRKIVQYGNNIIRGKKIDEK